MKNLITLLMCTLSIITAMAQSDLSGDQMVIPERTPALKALYQHAKDLEENGTAAEINANRLAIKNAWQAVDPNVAALYKPILSNKSILIEELFSSNTSNRHSGANENMGQSKSPEDWGTDRLLRSGYIDGVDMDVTKTGDIYIVGYENMIDYGGTGDPIFIYRSTDYGRSFEWWTEISINTPCRKIEAITLDGGGDDYLLVYVGMGDNRLMATRWNLATKAAEAQIMATDILDFSVDRNYPSSTSSQRVFATYQKSDHMTYSARSTAGSYGLDWVDETSLGIYGEQIAFAYGNDGGCYTTFIGYNTKGLLANTNSDSNDPASWGAYEIVADGAVTETLNPTISAARKSLSSDRVLILASSRAAGTSDTYKGQGYKRVNEGAYAPIYYNDPGNEFSNVHIDSWIRRVNDVETIQTASVLKRGYPTHNDWNFTMPYNGTSFGDAFIVGDQSESVFSGFASVVAESLDGLPCLAFARTSSDGLRGDGLYFDRKSTLGMEENSFQNFQFYPNPTNDIVNLSANNTIESLSVFSLLGQKVMDVSVNQNSSSINIESLTHGVYLMKVMIDGKSATYKIIKK